MRRKNKFHKCDEIYEGYIKNYIFISGKSENYKKLYTGVSKI